MDRNTQSDYTPDSFSSVADRATSRHGSEEVGPFRFESATLCQSTREAELVAANRRLEAENERLRTLAYGVAHDLRAPLRAIQQFGEIVAEEHASDLDDEARYCIDHIRDAAGHGHRIIDALLALGDASSCGLREQPVDLAEIAGEVVNELRAAASRRDVEFVVGEGLHTRADRGLMCVLLQNLIGNAFKFTAHVDRARIEFGTVSNDSGATVFFVRDNGAGFDPVDAERMFAPFERLHARTEFDGTGIGLATVTSIVARHGGRVWADGCRGKGATVYFTLPRSMVNGAVNDPSVGNHAEHDRGDRAAA